MGMPLAKSAKSKTHVLTARKPPTLSVARTALVALTTVLVGGAAMYGLTLLRGHVREAPTHQVSAGSLRLVKGPAWMTPAVLAELDVALLDPAFPQRFSLLDDGVLRRIAAAYESCVWVERVERIVKRDPRADLSRPPLEIHLKFRRPAVFVESRGGFCLIDAAGVRLPGVYVEPRLGGVELLVVSGAGSERPDVGQVWSDARVDAGVRVAEAVALKRRQFRLASIDVSNVGGRRDPRETEVALLTAKGTRIKWGKAPTADAALLQEKTPEEKVAYLDFVYKHMNGQVDGVLAYIDIPNEAVRRRPSGAGARLRR
jgi:hypothetical protein